MKANVKFAILTGTVLILVICLNYALGNVPQVITGEANYDFMFVDRYPFPDEITKFFQMRVEARYFHGAILSMLYGLLGFFPPSYYLLMQILVVSTGVLAALVFADYLKKNWMMPVLVIAFSCFPLVVPELLALKKIHHVFAWFFFWGSILGIKLWIETKMIAWLAMSFFCFTLSILSYEAAILLMPIGVFAIAGLYPQEKRRAFTGVLIASLIGFGIYYWLSGLNSAGIRSSSVSSMFDLPFLIRMLAQSPLKVLKAVWSNGLIETTAGTTSEWLAIPNQVILITAAIIFIWVLVSNLRQLSNPPSSAPLTQRNALLAASLWLSVCTYLPFMLSGQSPDSDSLKGAAFGLVLIFLIPLVPTDKLKSDKLKFRFEFLAVLVFLFYALCGISMYFSQLNKIETEHAQLTRFVYSLKLAVPYVQENTTFILVNANFGRTGCIGLMNMLYARDNLHCIHLLDHDREEEYIWSNGILIEKPDGRTFEPDFVIIGVTKDGTAYLIESLARDRYPFIPVEWEDESPIPINQERITEYPYGTGDSSPLWDYMEASYYQLEN